MQKLVLCIFSLVMVFGCRENQAPPTHWGDIKFDFIVTDNNDITLRDLNLFVFDSLGMLIDEYYFDDISDVNYGDGFRISHGVYFFAAAINCGEPLEFEAKYTAALASATKADMNISSFRDWMESEAGNYYDALSGILHKVVFRGDQRFSFTVHTSEYNYALEHNFTIKLPTGDLPEFVSSRDGDKAHLRVMANIASTRAGEFAGVRRAWLNPTDNDSEYTFSLPLFEGNYKVSLWVDYSDNLVEDKYYDTSIPNKVSVLERDSYFANTLQKDGFWANTTLEIEATGDTTTLQNTTIEMVRPLARYLLQTTDIDKYREYMTKDSSLPAPEDLSVHIYYEGFFPSEFNIAQGVVSDARTGYGFEGTNIIDGNIMHLATDYIFAVGETFSDLTVEFMDSEGNVVSRCEGIRTKYAGGMESTISGAFLTKGIESSMGGGVNVDTEWDDDIDYKF